jgi:hypothetical protein
MDLLTTDLIWVNGESEYWRHPDEIGGLEGLAKTPVSHKVGGNVAPAKAFTASTCSAPESKTYTSSATEVTTSEAESEPPSFEKLKEKYSTKTRKRKIWRSQLNIAANLMGLAVLLIGLSAIAFMIKKAVDNIEYEPIAETAVAREITFEGSLTNTTSQAAKTTIGEQPAVAVVQQPTDDKMEVLLPAVVSSNAAENDRALSAKNKLRSQNESLKEESAQTSEKPAEQAILSGSSEVETAPEKLIDVEKEKAEEKAKDKPEIQLAVNDYKVGFLGGITNLQITVVNPSSKAVGKAVVEVEYLKPSGKVAASQRVEVNDIAPGASKKIPVPDKSRGVSVRYRVVTVEG